MAPVFSIEPETRLSTYGGMLFGQVVNDANSRTKVWRYWVLKDGRPVIWYRLRREAQAYIDRQLAS